MMRLRRVAWMWIKRECSAQKDAQKRVEEMWTEKHLPTLSTTLIHPLPTADSAGLCDTQNLFKRQVNFIIF